MAPTSSGDDADDARRDPAVDGPRTFDRHPQRLQMALACRQPRPLSRLARVTRQADPNARTTARTLVRYGVLEPLTPPGGPAAVCLSPDWLDAVEEARRRAARGRVERDQRLLLVTKASAAAFYRLMANRYRDDPRVAWAARVPDGAGAGLLVAVDAAVDEDAAERFFGELRAAEVDCSMLRVGRLAGYGELRGFCAESLPGAFGDDT
jgi:hypothetical protein